MTFCNEHCFWWYVSGALLLCCVALLQSEIRAGCPKQGEGLAREGFSVADLIRIAEEFKGENVLTFLHSTLDEKDQKGNEAALLLLKNAIPVFMSDAEYANKVFSLLDHLLIVCVLC